MDRKEKVSYKLLSSKVKSIRPYKSRSSRPCDFCRKRKTCCIIKDLIPCMACIGFNKGRCTFLEGPIKRTKKVGGVDHDTRLSNDLNGSMTECIQNAHSNISSGQSPVPRMKQQRQKNSSKNTSSLTSHVGATGIPKMPSSSMVGTSGSNQFSMTSTAFQQMEYSSPQSMYSYHTSPAIPNETQNVAMTNSSIFLGQTLSQPQLHDEDLQESYDQSQYSLETSNYPPLPSVSIQSEIGGLNAQNRFRPQSAQPIQTARFQGSSLANTLFGSAVDPAVREEFLASCSQSAPCDVALVSGYFEQPKPFVSQSNVSDNSNTLSTHRESQYSMNTSYNTSSINNTFPSFSHQNSSKFPDNSGWSIQSQKFTPQLSSSTNFNQHPTPMSTGPNIQSTTQSFNEDIFAMDDGNIGYQSAHSDSFYQKNHQQFQDRIHQSESFLPPEYFDSFGISTIQQPEHNSMIGKFAKNREFSNNMSAMKPSSAHPQNSANCQLLAPLYNQLFLPLDHAIPEPLYLMD